MAATGKSTQSRPRLGRGLSSLISNSRESAAQEGQYQGSEQDTITQAPQDVDAPGGAVGLEVAPGDISPNPYQPRQDFAEEGLAELAQSIAQQGILQPLIVAESADADAERRYVLIAGERRLRAAEIANLPTVPCIVREVTGQQMLEWALIENIQRSDLNSMERAEAYRSYVDRFSLTQAEAAERLGQPRATIANYLRIMDLCATAQLLVRQGVLSFGHAKVLASLAGNPQRQEKLAKKAAAEGLSVRELERLAGALAKSDLPGAEEPERRGPVKPAYIRDLEEQLTHAVGTRVSISPGRAKNRGKIVVEYYGLEDFDRISGLLGLNVES